MAKNTVLNPDEFNKALSPSNPNGDMRSASAFSAMVDAVPTVGPLWVDSGNKVSSEFTDIVGNANTLSQPTDKQKAIYKKAYDYLNTETKTTDFEDNVKLVTNPSPRVVAFDDNQSAYIAAVSGYRTAFNGYNLDKTEDQRAWNAVAPSLQNTLTQAWNKWTREGKAEVVQAQNALASTINDAVRHAIEEAQRLVGDQHQLAPMTPGGESWLLSYALPAAWATAAVTGSKLTFKSSTLNKSESESANSYSAAASGSWGLWHASAEVGGETKETNAHMDADNLTIEAELIAVSIKRPWFNPLLFSMKDWFVNGFDKGGISSGDPNKLTGSLPLVPTGFVIARNVKISADFSSSDEKFISNAISTKASGGWGPFSISGSYGHSDSKKDFTSKLDGGTLQLPGLQLLAWISAVTPASPPLDPAKDEG
ncbi:MAG: hypothetical protein ACR2KK_18630 [Acidimicrobiales bacterium]